MVDSFCLKGRKRMKNFQKSTFQFIHFHLIPDQKNPCQNINILYEDFIKMGLSLPVLDMAFS